MVPAGAEVWIEGAKMSQRGPARIFVSPPLEPGKNFSYEIVARWNDNGQPVERRQEVPVRANQWSVANFMGATASDDETPPVP